MTDSVLPWVALAVIGVGALAEAIKLKLEWRHTHHRWATTIFLIALSAAFAEVIIQTQHTFESLRAAERAIHAVARADTSAAAANSNREHTEATAKEVDHKVTAADEFQRRAAEAKAGAEREKHKARSIEEQTEFISEIALGLMGNALDETTGARDVAVDEAKKVAETQKTVTDQIAAAQKVLGALKDDAEKAKRDAETAKSDAEKAKREAEKAKTDAEAAKGDAEKAKRESEKAKSDAETAKGDAEKAKREAEKAKADAETAKAGAEAAKGDAVKAKGDLERELHPPDTTKGGQSASPGKVGP